MARIRHDYYEMNPFYRVILPHRCDQLLFGVESTTNIADSNPNDNELSNMTTITANQQQQPASTAMVKRRKSTKKSRKMIMLKKSKELSNLDMKTSDDDDDGVSKQQKIRQNKPTAKYSLKTNDNDGEDEELNRSGGGCSSGGTSSSASPFHRHSSKTSSFSKSSLKQFLFPFKRRQPIMTSDCDTQQSDYDLMDDNSNQPKRLKSEKKIKNNKQQRNLRSTASMKLSPFWRPKKLQSSLLIDSEIGQTANSRRAISIPNLCAINSMAKEEEDEQMMSEPINQTNKIMSTNQEPYTQTEDDDDNDIGGGGGSSDGGNHFKYRSKMASSSAPSLPKMETKKMSRLKRIKRDMHRMCLQRNQQQKFHNEMIQSDDSCIDSEKSLLLSKQPNNKLMFDSINNDNSIESNNNKNDQPMAPIAIMNEQNDEPIMMSIDDNQDNQDNNQQQQQQQIALAKPKIRILKTKKSNQTSMNNNIEQSSDNGVGGNDSGNNSDEMSSTTITEMNVKNCLSETDDTTTTTLLTKAQNCNNDTMRLQRIHRLLQYPFFQIDIHLKYGDSLLAKDSCGTSDPYVKFMLANKIVYKSQIKYKTLNPNWDEYFVLPVDNICEPLILKVFDYDLFFMDDYLGTASIDLTKLEPGITTDLELCLHDSNSNGKDQKLSNQSPWGKILLSIRLNPKTREERDYYYNGRGKWTTISSADGQTNKRIKSQLYDSIVSIVLIKGDEIDLDRDYCIRMKLGAEKYKSKSVSKSVHSPYWAEQFDLHLFADQSKVLEIILGYSGQHSHQNSNSNHHHHHRNHQYNQNNDFIDKVCTDLSELEPEHTHRFVYEFNCSTTNATTTSDRNSLTSLSSSNITSSSISGGNSMVKSLITTTTTTTKKLAKIEMLITITGLQSTATSIKQQQNTYDLIEMQQKYHQQQQQPQQQQQQQQDNSLQKLFPLPNMKDLNNFYENFFDIGTLIVKVHRAENLASADINGKSDPFCVLELVNERLRTSTDYKTLSPVWNKLFKFKIQDIHDVLEVTVYDEDKDRVEFLGKIAIPLLKVKNGEKHWYALKDKKLRHRVKGHIFLECWITYNPIKASILTFTPRPTKYVQNEIKFKRTLFIRNAMRLKNICLEFVEIGQFLHSCIQWESPTRSIIAFITFLASVYYFEFYMIPLVIVLYTLMNYIGIRFRSIYSTKNDKSYHQDDNNNYVDNGSDSDEYINESRMIDEDYDEKAEEKKSFKEKLQTVQDLSTLIMLIIGEVASYIERCKNATNFTVPYLTWLAVICMSFGTIILYFIPIRYLILLWGINKFTKKFRAPDSINNNEIIDFLSRVPDMEEKLMYKQFKPTINLDDLNDNETIIQPIQQQRQESNPINQNPDGLKQQQCIDSSMTLDTNNNNVNGANTTTTIIMDRKMKKRK
uniref:Uncharacterized protein LOC113790024 isoform X2 n=1 Tax=Dermatophagoides pteronyssinus TaxID=6956 RepID=A0A6P6XPT5_DERPT|nr:uncharacterized protein LOC113790024 isoform X2 [Dermatophagoides pteronyssinus]